MLHLKSNNKRKLNTDLSRSNKEDKLLNLKKQKQVLEQYQHKQVSAYLIIYLRFKSYSLNTL
jgi:hypothetical protein